MKLPNKTVIINLYERTKAFKIYYFLRSKGYKWTSNNDYFPPPNTFFPFHITCNTDKTLTYGCEIALENSYTDIKFISTFIDCNLHFNLE